jgi:alpha-acetolactate decarboxylase
MKALQVTCTTLVFAFSFAVSAATFDVHVIGQMRRMFMAHDIGPNVDVHEVTKQRAHIYALGPVASLKGEVTIIDGDVFTSKVTGSQPTVAVDANAKTVFLVYASVPAWRSINIPTNVVSETDLASFLERSLPANTRSPFLVRGTAVRARYHIQNYQGKAEDLTHEAHDKAKVFFDLSDTAVQLIGFFTNREEDGGSFVHLGQTTHIHLISGDRKAMGHLKSVTLAPGAILFLPEAGRSSLR